MRVRSSKKWQNIDKQEIINYEYRMIELSLPLVSPVIANTDKYLPWDLDSKVKDVVGSNAAAVRWVGNTSTAYLEAYAYLLLVATGLSQAGLLEFKHSIYRLGKKCLQLAQQKLLVEFLCLIEYSRDRYSFLNKYPQIQAILIKVLQYLEEEHTNSDDSAPQQSRKAKIRRRGQRTPQQGSSQQSRSISLQMEYEKQLQQIYQCFNKHFQFLTLLSSNEYSCTFRLLDSKKLHVLIEKECYFMVEPMERENDAPSQTQGNPKTDDRFASLDSSNVDFDRKEFLQIFEFKNEVQESNVISIQRGSQIRKPSTTNMLQTLGSSNTPKFNNHISHNFPAPQEFEIQRNDERIENDRTFIDQLLNNAALQSDNDLRGQPKEKPSAVKRKIENNMKNILNIKEELRIVRKKIEDKIRLIDEAQAQKDLIKKNNSPSEKQTSVKDRQSKKGQQFQGNIVKESLVKKHESSLFLKKQRKTSYNSVKIIPYQSRHQRHDDLLDLESINSPVNRKSANHYVNRVERMLSEKGSRPHSNLKPILQQQTQVPRSKSPQAKRINGNGNDFAMRSMSPKSVNVNVNVNINENHISPPFQQHAYSRPFPHFYPSLQPQPQYIPNPNFSQNRAKAKIPNPEQLYNNHSQPRFMQANKA